ncbi:acyl-protein synthetase [bacterium]|nr:MAG: acyl-protein synthetase [bacterium]
MRERSSRGAAWTLAPGLALPRAQPSADVIDQTGSVAALDARILEAVERGLDAAAFDRLARDLFAYQVQNDAPYGRWVRSLGWSERRMPAGWREIPAIPSPAFKEAALATFPLERAALRFETSGTTQGRPGAHYVERPALYEASLLAGFRRFMLPDGASLRYLNLVPDPAEAPHSSLGYMMRTVARELGEDGGFFLHSGALELDAFLAAARRAQDEGSAVCIAGTAFAYVHLFDALRGAGITLHLPEGSRAMETGGFKGRSREVGREELYAEFPALLGIPRERVVAEYGMTELLSQHYDVVLTEPGRALHEGRRVKSSPPWLRVLVIDPQTGHEAPLGTVGALRHVDLANRSSVAAIQTEDLGYALDATRFVLLGRQPGAVLRGCSLDAEALAVLHAP